jgi:hypothetical protein
MKTTGKPSQGTTAGTAAPAAFHFGDLASYGPPEPVADQESLREPPERPYVPDLPDFRRINQTDVIDVARKVGFEVEIAEGKDYIVCPLFAEHRSERVRHLKRISSNNRVVCEACDTYPMSVLDMVQYFGGYETVRDAAEYVASHYPDIPRKRKASYLNNPKGEAVPEGCQDPWTLLIKSGIWAELSSPSQRLIPILLTFAKWRDDEEKRPLPLSQRAMMRYSGIASFTPINEALTELKAIGWLERLPVATRDRSPERETAKYVITPLSQRVREFADRTGTRLGQTIFQDKAIRRRERQERNLKRMFPNLRTS